MKKIIAILIFFVFQNNMVHAQQWLQDMYDPNVNFFTVQQEFSDWWSLNKDSLQKGNGEAEIEGNWVLYKRWEHQMLPSMTASNGVRLGDFDSAAYYFNRQRNSSPVERSSAAWSYMGPQNAFRIGNINCKGRLNCVRFDPNNSNTIFVGAPSGGLWKSTDAGQTWVLMNTDTLAQIGVTDIAIDYTNNQNIYMATGDYANNASISIGVLKSTNGGASWSPTGLTWTTTQGMEISRLIMNPQNPGILLAATNRGIYRTTDAGVTWTRVSTLPAIRSMEFKPGDPNVIYACNNRFYRSVNGGTTWNVITIGLPPAASVNALAIGVTAADTGCVYVQASLSAASGTAGYNSAGGLYRSADGGSTFTLQSTPSQLLTQGSYDLTIAVSPINSNILVVGGEATANSDNGGLSFKYATSDAHVDHHDMQFAPGSGNAVYSADDGGLFLSTDSGATWTGLNNGLNIGQIYVVAPSQLTSYFDMTGRQDDGTLLQRDANATNLAPGDGTNCVVDPTDDDIMYGSIQQGLFAKSTDMGQNYSIITDNWLSGVNGPSEWVTPFVLDPQHHNYLYIGKDFIYKSMDEGTTWNSLNSPVLGNGIYWHYIALAPSDPNFIYATGQNALVSSANGGVTFNVITGGPTNIWSLAVSPNHPNKVWAAASGGVYVSVDTGHTWTNFSTGLPPVSSYHPYSIICLKNSPEAVYVGLYDGGGVYYTDSTLSSWVPFGTGLPNTSVENLQISYAAGTVRAATYGRDLWECPLYNNWYNPPVSQFRFIAENCTGDSVQFNDVTSFGPTSWNWSFAGGNPSTSTVQNPLVTFPTAGTYTVSLTTTNQYGTNTVTRDINSAVCADVENVQANKSVLLYPSPANNSVAAESPLFIPNKITALVYDITGRAVNVSIDYYTGKIMLHLEGLSDGVYVLRVQAGETIVSGKFVKMQ